MARPVLAALMALVLAAVGVAARQGLIHIYVWNGSGYSKGGTMPSGQESSMTIVCKNGHCKPRESCDVCHTNSSATAVYSNQALHDREFARRAVRVSDAPMAFGALTLRRSGTQLTLGTAGRDPIVRFPADAVVLPDRSGQAAFIFYRGDQPPRP